MKLKKEYLDYSEDHVLRSFVQETMLLRNQPLVIPLSSVKPSFHEIKSYIFERSYVTDVLGLDIPLNESYPYTPSFERRIIQEQLLMEGFFSDILQKGKDMLISAKEGIKKFGEEAWSVLQGFYLAIKEGKAETLFRAIAGDIIKSIYMPIKKALTFLVEKLPEWNMPTFADWAQKGMDFLKKIKDGMMSAKGWKKVAMASGVAIGLKLLWGKIGDWIDELKAMVGGDFGDTTGLDLALSEGEDTSGNSKVQKIIEFLKDSLKGAIKGAFGGEVKDLIKKVAMAPSIASWWTAAKAAAGGAALVADAIGGATKKFVDDHEEGQRIKKGTTAKEQNEALLRQIIREALLREAMA